LLAKKTLENKLLLSEVWKLISDLGEIGFGKTVSLLTEIGKLSFFNKIFVQHSGFKMNTNFPFKMVNFNKNFYVFFHVSLA
jgi:hypothetical protein